MKTSQEIRQEAQQIDTPDNIDIVRRRYLRELHEQTGNDTVLYAVDCLNSNPFKTQFAGPFLQISLADKDGFDEVTRNLSGQNLDVILHSPGGSAEATESIVKLLRARFTGEIRFIVPNLAKSAATMLAMSGDWIIMDERSELGPTDPQLVIMRDHQQIVAPAQAIKDQFEMAQNEINGDPKRLPGWVPLLQQYGPALLAECDNHIDLSKELVTEWLTSYMFAGDPEAATKAGKVAEYLSNHNNFRSHARRVDINNLRQHEVKVIDLAENENARLRDAISNVYTAMAVTLADTGALKMFENHKGEASIIVINVQAEQPAQPPPSPPPPNAGKSTKPGSQPKRGQRR